MRRRYRSTGRAERPAPWHARQGGEQKRRFEGSFSSLTPRPSRRRASTIRYGGTRSRRGQAHCWLHGHPSSHAVRLRCSLRDRTACRMRRARAVACCLLETSYCGASLSVPLALTAALHFYVSFQLSSVLASRPRQLERQRGAKGDRRRCDNLYTVCRAWQPRFPRTAGAAAESLLRTDPS